MLAFRRSLATLSRFSVNRTLATAAFLDHKVELPNLPYAYDALEPHVGKHTLECHHGGHHKAYVTKVQGTDGLDGKNVVDIMKESKSKNDADTFFWSCMKPGGGGAPTGDLGNAINESFGSYDAFATEFKTKALGVFGSGWVWLTFNTESKKLEIVPTPGAETPLMAANQHPILTCDVWEHAYYLDHQFRRADFVQVFLDKLVNWEFASEQYANRN